MYSINLRSSSISYLMRISQPMSLNGSYSRRHGRLARLRLAGVVCAALLQRLCFTARTGIYCSLMSHALRSKSSMDAATLNNPLKPLSSYSIKIANQLNFMLFLLVAVKEIIYWDFSTT